MQLRANLLSTVLGTLWILFGAMQAGAGAGIDADFSGRLNLESRWFPEAGAHSGQGSYSVGLVAAPEIHLAGAGGGSLTMAPFLRYDSADRRRTHADLREAYVLLFGAIGEGEWELRLGMEQVFWGVAESQHLVDIVNQVDLVEHPGGEAKLGQPMVHCTWSATWGIVELLALPYHRKRTFPGRSGRLRLPLVIDDRKVEYESEDEERNLDLAARYSHSFASLDLGISAFDGTSREPSLQLVPGPGGVPSLRQHYAQISQYGLDAQLTAGPWLLKLEAIRRSGAPNLSGREEDYLASVIGAEYSFYSAFGTAADLSLLGEWNYDGRGRKATPSRSPNTLENDYFLAARLAFNDVHGSEFIASFLGDAGRGTRTLVLELDRRISGGVSINLESIHLLGIDEADLHYATRKDSFIDLVLRYSF